MVQPQPLSTKTTVVGQIFRSESNLPWAGARVHFTLIPGSYTSQKFYPSDRVTAVTDADGEFSIEL